MKTYNKKAFLLPDSINSCACYHAKIFEDGRYIFRIHDCITGIRLNGDLNTKENIAEAFSKINELIIGLEKFRDFIFENFIKNNRYEKSNNQKNDPYKFQGY
ncbi:MAG: hypothetical protein LBS01_04445 [Prevotellaceae bacterium]|jgi:hypothetical protein|nr:hypothetical protein [Prevotellaceae bacterium]